MRDDKSTEPKLLKTVVDTLSSPLGKIAAWIMVALIGVGGTAVALEVSMVTAASVLLVAAVAVAILVFLGNLFGG